ncbi:MAG: transcription-repair coupling factor [Dehalococcoidales bacterium]|nr:transcription-repair coupling factor [Dehalococcoidales bacterium]
MSFILTALLKLIDRNPAIANLVDTLKHVGTTSRIEVPDAVKPYLIAAVHHHIKRPVLVVTSQPEEAKNLFEQITCWTGTDAVRLFPEPDALPYQRVVTNSTTEAERLEALALLAKPYGNIPLVVTSIPAVLHKTPSAGEFINACHHIKSGEKTDLLYLLRRWEQIGYRSDTLVEIPGTMSRRGGILDIFPPASDMPFRLEFLGNTIESIRTFDPVSQRSLSKVNSISICPATEVFLPLKMDPLQLNRVIEKLDYKGCSAEICRQFEQELEMLSDRQRPRNLPFYAPLFNNDTILQYLPPNGLLILDEPDLQKQTAEIFDREMSDLRAQRIQSGELPESYPRPYFGWGEISPVIDGKSRLILAAFGISETETVPSGFSVFPGFGGQLPQFIEKVKQLLKQKRRLVITSYQAGRLEELFDEAGLTVTPTTEIKQLPLPGSITLVQGSLSAGWSLNNETYVFTDAEIFGFVKRNRLVHKHPVARHKMYTDFVPGDFVVHIEHGIGKFAGVINMGNNGKQREYLVLKYAAGDKLYVPTDQIDRVTRYIGAGEKPPVLTRLGTQEWSQTKKRVKESVENVAKDLLALYAAREALPGFAFTPDNLWQQEFEASFPYIETPDQIDAVNRVKEDMEKPKPMDRLVCGDVGYGKTEIAVRAAFKAVMDGKQVAVLVPTTILAQQHYNTFRERMEAFPVQIDMLSRFRTNKEQKAALAGLADGNVDICIGTHRLIQKDVEFKNLGLLIIDEEQRFGVAHKEYLKKLRRDVHVLTLSATPIPRTLHMALVGVRDMSTIETPPEARLPIKTYIAEYDDRLVREAILKEMERNGQVFFVHNRVQSIYQMAAKLQILVPEARVSVAHGRMREGELEKVMTEFIAGKTDVLVCSTIIESGLDMPNVNTMIVNRADKFGLTQLYQLRGRIGRGTNLAYAYFLYDKGKNISPTAEKRLKTIYEATELGAGFGIALKDLEIRGAGTLLGIRQSGYISSVGFELYLRLLGQAVEELKSKRAGTDGEKVKQLELPETTIDLPLPAYIPGDYIADVDTRIALYQSLSKADARQIERLAGDFKDRFGAPPAEVNNLLYAVRLKALAANAVIESISTEDGRIVIRRFRGMPFNRYKLRDFMREGIDIGITHLYIDPKLVGDWPVVLEEVVRRVIS